MGRNVLVTGGTGFCGVPFLERLVREYPEDYVMAMTSKNPSCAKADVLKRSYEPLTEAIKQGRVNFFHGNILPDIQNTAIDPPEIPDVIHHLAADTSFDKKNDDKVYRTNVEGTELLLNCAELWGVKEFHYFGTMFAAGRTRDVVPEGPLKDPKEGYRFKYEETKRKAEDLVRSELEGTDIKFSIYRMPIEMADSVNGNTYGDPRMIYGYILGVTKGLQAFFGKKKVDFKRFWLEQHNGERLKIDEGLRLSGYANGTTLDLSPIDDTLGCVMEILKQPASNLTYNLCNPRFVNGQEICNAFNNAFKVEGIIPANGDIREILAYEDEDKNRDKEDKKDKYSRILEKMLDRSTRPLTEYTLFPNPVATYDNTTRAIDGRFSRIPMTEELLTHLTRKAVEHYFLAQDQNENGNGNGNGSHGK